MIRAGFDTATPAGVIAEQIMAWCDEAAANRIIARGDDADATQPARRRLGLRQAAAAVLAAWEALDDQAMPEALLAAVNALRVALRPATPPCPAGQPREGTKQARVLAMLRRPEGATLAHIAEAMAWQLHTVRAVLTGLRKKGIRVEVVDRIKQLGPDTAGAKGSYSIYRLADEIRS